MRLPRIGELGITKLRCNWGARYSQGLVYLRARGGGKPGSCDACPGAGLGREMWKGIQKEVGNGVC